ncbi:MAG: hypothetical protein AAB382_11010 [Chloroflexota bacterium]
MDIKNRTEHDPVSDLKIVGAYMRWALLSFFGRAAKSMVLRIGCLSAKQGIDQQGAMFGIAAPPASKLLPYPTQVKLGLEAMREALTPAEIDTFTAHMRPLVEAGNSMQRSALMYLWAVK